MNDYDWVTREAVSAVTIVIKVGLTALLLIWCLYLGAVYAAMVW